MSWLQKRPQISDPTYYSIGQNKTVLIVGLGNPGAEYEATRHNVGFMCLDEFVAKSEEMENWVQKKDLKGFLSGGRMGNTRVMAFKPTTYMNLSGEAVQAIMSFYKLSPANLVVIHDELDIDFGQIRMRTGGSTAGHKGIASLSQHIGENYGRIRIGVGPKKPVRIKSEDFVLQKFSDEQVEQLPNLKREVNAILSEYIYGSELPHDTRNFLV